MHANYGLVILSFNHPELTEKCVRSVLELGFPVTQIFLVHNGSEKKWVQQLKLHFGEAQHVILPFNKGYSGGANAGFLQAFSLYDEVFMLTNDTEMLSLPEKFPKDIDLIAPVILKRQTETIDSLMGYFDSKTGDLRHIRDSRELHIQSLGFYVPGTAFGLRKSCFNKLNGFDESFHTYWEDVDFSLRAQDENFKLGHSNLFQLRHKIGKTCHKDRFYTLYLFQRNRRKLMKKRGLASPTFYFHYFLTMLRLLKNILIKPNRRAPLLLWWKAIYE